MEPKQEQYPVVDVTGGRSKVRCCKEQYCIETWNVRSMNQGKLEVVKQEMARVNIDILGISELWWTGMGEFNSDDHYIYYCGQESFSTNGVAIIVNKRVWNAVLGCKCSFTANLFFNYVLYPVIIPHWTPSAEFGIEIYDWELDRMTSSSHIWRISNWSDFLWFSLLISLFNPFTHFTNIYWATTKLTFWFIK